MRKTVGARELKTRLGTYLHQVQRGATIVVTDRGQPVAEEIRPLDQDAREEEARLAELATSGMLTRKAPISLTPFRPIRSMGASLSAAITEDREDRF